MRILVMSYILVMGILNIDLNDVNLDNSFDEDDPDTFILIRPLVKNLKNPNT